MIRYLIGDVFDRMAELADGSIDLILTSPPFLALRSYLPADHPDKGREIGSESSPAEFVDALLRLTAEWRRLLTDRGSLVVELGDTYSGSGGGGGDYLEGGWRESQPKFAGSASRVDSIDRRSESGWPLPKCLALVPELYRVALAYGINPLTGQESPAGRWRVRNVVRWVRPNPPVGALADKFRPATSTLVVACTSKDRWFDLDAVRTPLSGRRADTSDPRLEPNKQRDGQWNTLGPYDPSQTSGAPPLDWWNITTGGYPGAHYAVWPPELLTIPIKSMCPEKVCQTCGQPSRRITKMASKYAAAREALGDFKNGNRDTGLNATVQYHNGEHIAYETVGWTDCGHDTWRPGIVLDPFAGTGTTGMVASGLGRNCILIDIDERNAKLAEERCGRLFLTVE